MGEIENIKHCLRLLCTAVSLHGSIFISVSLLPENDKFVNTHPLCIVKTVHYGTSSTTQTTEYEQLVILPVCNVCVSAPQ